MKKIAKTYEKESGAKISLSFIQRADAAPMTPTDSEIVKRLRSAIEEIRGVRPHPLGIGGGDVRCPL